MKLSHATILLADDEPVLREIFANWLSLSGIGTVLTAADGQQALEILTREKVDVLITDVRMPILDGVALIRRLAQVGHMLPCVLVVSGFGDVDERELYALGVEAFLSKPVNRADLISILQRAVAERHERWLVPMASSPRQSILLHAKHIGSSVEIDTVSLGSGGFSAHCANPITLGKVAFHCSFAHAGGEMAGRDLVGQGCVRWHSRADHKVGIEFEYLESNCRSWVVEHILATHPRSFIPGT